MAVKAVLIPIVGTFERSGETFHRHGEIQCVGDDAKADKNGMVDLYTSTGKSFGKMLKDEFVRLAELCKPE